MLLGDVVTQRFWTNSSGMVTSTLRCLAIVCQTVSERLTVISTNFSIQYSAHMAAYWASSSLYGGHLNNKGIFRCICGT